MKILVIGSGGREHALVWKLAQSPRTRALYCAPGNPGIARYANCLPVKADDIQGLLNFAVREKVDLTVVGPEGPLTLGIVDRFHSAGCPIIGPGQKAAEIESSKVYAKRFMEKHGIPTAPAGIFEDPQTAVEYIRRRRGPVVVKADGLAAGKGVVVAKDANEAIGAVDRIMRKKEFGEAGNRVVIEDRLEGEEVSVLIFTDGKNVIPMPPSQDHKRARDGDEGPNTGGMGAYSPTEIASDELLRRIRREVIEPTVEGLSREGRPFRGILYAGMMLTREGPRVLEFNARFGDPETQVILVRLETDLVEILEALAAGRLDQIETRWRAGAAVCVVVAAKGYPGDYETRRPITGIENAESGRGVMVFHAGTSIEEKRLVTAGGRVLGVTAIGADLTEARGAAYKAIGQIHFEGMQFRTDIGGKGIRGSVK